MSGRSLDSINLSAKQAYIASLGRCLASLNQSAHASRQKDNFQRSIRAMSIWGAYPWRRLDNLPRRISALSLLVRFLTIPLSTINGVLYFSFKYLEYLPYRQFRKLDYSKRKVGVFSPTLHLKEFSDRSYTGFWGELKFLDSSLRADTAWFLIPYRPIGASNRRIAREISHINQGEEFLLIPLAAFLSFGVLIEAIFQVLSFHAFIAKLFLLELINHSNDKLSYVLGFIDLGISLSRTELNRHFITSAMSGENQLKNCIHLMEGQSWEIALNDLSSHSNFGCWGVIHTPLRGEDSQILNYLLAINGKSLAEQMQGICCPGELSLNYLRELGLTKKLLRLVEAQRFNHYREVQKFTYSNNSKKILYVADANLETTKLFVGFSRSVIAKERNLDLQFFIQPHPSQVHLEFEMLQKLDVAENREFGLIIFGPQTSSFIQSEFGVSNIRIFSPFTEVSYSPLGVECMIPRIEAIDSVGDQIKNQFKLGVSADSIAIKDSSFTKWRLLIDELL